MHAKLSPILYNKPVERQETSEAVFCPRKGVVASALPCIFPNMRSLSSKNVSMVLKRGLSPGVPREVKKKICCVLPLLHFVSSCFQTDTLLWSFRMVKYFGDLHWLPTGTTTARLSSQTQDWASEDSEWSSHWGKVRALELVSCSCWSVGVPSGTSYAHLASLWPQFLFSRIIFSEMLGTYHWDLVFRCASSWALK